MTIVNTVKHVILGFSYLVKLCNVSSFLLPYSVCRCVHVREQLCACTCARDGGVEGGREGGGGAGGILICTQQQRRLHAAKSFSFLNIPFDILYPNPCLSS